MTSFHPVLPHGSLDEVFPDVFFVQGTMKAEFFGSPWQFSRNMIVVREGRDLSLVNTVRLDDASLAALEALGTVKNVVRIGSLHGVDDPFYIDRYKAAYWAVAGMPPTPGAPEPHLLAEGGPTPFACEVFTFRETKLPEAILVIPREGGVAIACDSLQNWVAPDAYMDGDTVGKMTGMGFFQPANLGVAWKHVNEPKAGDFERLKALHFEHALCGHGVPYRGGARAAYHATFQRVMGV